MTNQLHTFVPIRLDEQEFHNIFNKYYVALCVFTNQYMEDEATAADIVQDCFAKLWQLRKDFNYLHQVKSFLYTAAKNKALNELEHCKVVDEYARKMVDKQKDSFFHDKIIEEETYNILINAIDKLPPQMKAIMSLAFEGKSNPEIAEALHVSNETVRTLKKTAYRKLRTYLKEYYYLLFLLY
ncbi:RNA polymerase sigma-70 factor [Phocaeicola sp.]|uniref:RNA polymerase sigma-70 factor n=1 Tax=Phocaeicola sp. TaxID=2773926 RepID=UPI0023D024BD|nr:RNA polymerase sigma-70 factor [Phocaeicola sp.]MDE5678328.1 RNA polymerase sigma-70 factor [Phocaeicola sp.]